MKKSNQELLQMWQDHNYDIHQRIMVESNNSQRRSDDHLHVLIEMIERGENYEREVLAEMANDSLSKAESSSVIGGNFE
jgi:hypothetical protein